MVLCKYTKRLLSYMGLVVALMASVGVNSEVLFSEGFESDLHSKANPKWAWREIYHPVSAPYGIMYGEGDIYQRSTAESLAGNYSLRLDFSGRSGWCNNCLEGTRTYYMTSALDDVNYFVDSSGNNLATQFDSTYRVYNKSDYFSRHYVSSISNDRVNFSSVDTSMGGNGLFSSGNEIKVAEECPAGARRSDCNLAINYLSQISASDFPYGGTLARRLYVYVPQETVFPSTVLKLGYANFDSGSTWTSIAAHRRMEVENESAGAFGYAFTGKPVTRDMWFYIEEVWTRETGAGQSDATYKIYVSEASNAKMADGAVREFSGFSIGAIQKMSIVGNWQHNNNSSGYVYLDEVQIATNRIGPALSGTAPMSPANLSIEVR